MDLHTEYDWEMHVWVPAVLACCFLSHHGCVGFIQRLCIFYIISFGFCRELARLATMQVCCLHSDKCSSMTHQELLQLDK